MIIYHVSIALDAAIESDWVAWMKTVHIPDVLSTGCFAECHMFRVRDPDDGEPRYVMQYHCSSLEEYDHYRKQYAPSLQKAHTDRYSGRFRGSRQVLEEV